MKSQPIPNPLYPVVVSAGVVLAGAIALMFLPALIQLDGMDGGFAITFGALFLAISALVTLLIFWRNAVLLDRVIAGTNLLAHWTYEPQEWAQYLDRERQEQIDEKLPLVFIVACWALLIGGGFWLFDPEAGFIVFLVMVGLIILVSLLAYGLPWLRFKRDRHRLGEVWIASSAIYFRGNFVHWGELDLQLEQVSLRPASENQAPCLCFELSYPSQAGMQYYNLRIPIPRRYRGAAYDLFEHFSQTTIQDSPPG
ncbi:MULTISPECIES: hypothetical protein [Cyanophyceae]|nr:MULTISPECIES: hypothetical protein [Cyanophyceae]ACB01150.1 hypothetical protein SYNPCC7002_G0110 [Picosynechococcus sp. PCC 7002]SMH48198.1 hypothetical protein SAMN06272755_1903 [Picosynechococcus sp. OG1]SMQ81237.1 hypothetical protein SAMN06272774_1182 [Synechococcus sp. 7002]